LGGAGICQIAVATAKLPIVRGLVAILLATFSRKRAGEILAGDASALFERLGLREHLTPQRSNGFRSMVERIRADSRAALVRGACALNRGPRLS
jgi:cysteine desulfuration protein SufE